MIWISNEKATTCLRVYLFLQGIIKFYLSWETLDLKMVQARFYSCPKFKRSFGNTFTRNSIQDGKGCFQGFFPQNFWQVTSTHYVSHHIFKFFVTFLLHHMLPCGTIFPIILSITVRPYNLDDFSLLLFHLGFKNFELFKCFRFFFNQVTCYHKL